MPKTTHDIELNRLPPPVSVEQALGERSVSIDVADGDSLTVGPFAKFAEAFRLVILTSFGDLQTLGLVAGGLSEEQSRNALIADDRMFREASRAAAKHGGSCGCEAPNRDEPSPVKRFDFQEALMQLLQPHHRPLLDARDSSVIHQYGRLKSWFSRPSTFILGIYSLRDINIGKRATLTMTPTVKAVYAGDINMEADSRLRFQSGTVHVQCDALNGPNRLLVDTNFERFVPSLALESGANP